MKVMLPKTILPKTMISTRLNMGFGYNGPSDEDEEYDKEHDDGVNV